MADNDIYIGKICASSDNTLAVVTSKKRIPIKGMRWFGFTLDGYPWKSRNPRVVADSLNEYIHQKIDERAFSLRDMYTDKLAVEKIRIQRERDQQLVDAKKEWDKENEKCIVEAAGEMAKIKQEIANLQAEYAGSDGACSRLVERQINEERKAYLGILRSLLKNANKSTTTAIERAVVRIDERAKERKQKRLESLNAPDTMGV